MKLHPSGAILGNRLAMGDEGREVGDEGREVGIEGARSGDLVPPFHPHKVKKIRMQIKETNEHKFKAREMDDN